MKSILKFMLTLVVLLTVAVGFANRPSLYVVNEGNAKLLVFRMDTQSPETKIKFADNRHNVIYSDITSGGSYAKKFDLRTLKSGNYFLKMEDKYKTVTYHIELEGSNVKIKDRTENVKPIFRKKGDVVFLNLLNLDKDEVVVKIYNSNNDLVYKQAIVSELLVEKAFDFGTSIEDAYTFVVTDNGTSYYETVEVN